MFKNNSVQFVMRNQLLQSMFFALNSSVRHIIVHSTQHSSDMAALGFEIYILGKIARFETWKQEHELSPAERLLNLL